MNDGGLTRRVDFVLWVSVFDFDQKVVLCWARFDEYRILRDRFASSWLLVLTCSGWSVSRSGMCRRSKRIPDSAGTCAF